MNRYGGKERIIGLLAADLADPFTQRFCRGVMKKAEETGGVRVYIFPGKYIDSADTPGLRKPYEHQYNTLFDYPSSCNLDGAVIIQGGLGSRTDRAHNERFLERFAGLPVVLAAADYKGFPAVNYDNKTGVREAMEYMINVMGLTRICMIGSGEGSIDAGIRRQVFLDCLANSRITFEARCYVECDLSGRNEAAAEQLLDRNPDAEAIFCANDEIARMLYRVMERRGLEPGRDIRVLGFDNDQMCTRMHPALASIGADVPEMGYRALAMVLDMIAGRQVESAVLPTQLYIRSSLDTAGEQLFEPSIDLLGAGHIEQLFDTIFYRYRDELHSRAEVDLRRCFYECVSRMVRVVGNRYVDDMQEREIDRLIHIFFRNGALQYTDTWFLLRHISFFQSHLSQRGGQDLGIAIAAPFFERIREQIALELSNNAVSERETYEGQLRAMQIMLGGAVGSVGSGDGDSRDAKLNYEAIFEALGRTGIRNALLYLFEDPILHSKGETFTPPQEMLLTAVYKQGSGLVIAPGRRRRTLAELFRAPELYAEAGSMAVYPLFYADTLYGLLLFDNVEKMYDIGEVFASALGAAVRLGQG